MLNNLYIISLLHFRVKMNKKKCYFLLKKKLKKLINFFDILKIDT